MRGNTYIIYATIVVIVVLIVGDWIRTGSESEANILFNALNGVRKESSTADYALASKESRGFFNNIHDNDWKRMKQHHKQVPNCKDDCLEDAANLWYQFNFEPTFSCAHEVRVGGMGDGPKWVCDPYRITEKNDCLVYSIGSNNEFSFEEAVHAEINDKCEIHTFDHTVGANPSNKPSYVTFHPWGMADKSSGSMKSLEDIITELHHEWRTIDVLKIDCTGCEWDTYKTIFGLPNVRQVQIELHRVNPKGHRPDGTNKAKELFEFAQENNFVVFHKEPNIAYSTGPGLCIEYSFLRLSKEFFQ